MPRGIPIVDLDLIETLASEFSVPVQRPGDPAGRATIGQFLARAAAAVELDAGTDFDSVVAPGVYTLTSDLNAPFDGGRWFLWVSADPLDPGAIFHRAAPITGGGGATTYVRRSYGGTFEDWSGGEGMQAEDIGWSDGVWWSTKTNIKEVLIDIGGSLNDPWAMQPIGVPIPVFDHISGVTPPPTDRSYRYIKLTAGETGAGGYNEGVLTGESVSGSAPYINATAVVNFAGSPINGQTIPLLNTEGRFLRAGPTSGALQDDTLKSHTHTVVGRIAQDGLSGSAFASAPGNGGPTSPVTNATGDTETRPRNIAVPLYMRIK